MTDTPLRYLSVCSGIEAVTVAWHPLGWKPLAFSEIDPFPRMVLKHHYPDIPLHGDFTALSDQSWIVDADVLVGGTPCQAFSTAGLRRSLEDDRGNLTLEYVRLANAIDDLRSAQGRDPAIIVWENVPGVLSVKDNAFGCFLGAIVGNDAPLVPTGGKWTNAGMVVGPERAAAWRILDAQYFGVAQRRRRLFVVASARKGFDPGEVLFEWEGVRRDHPPRREAQESVAGCLRSGTPGSGGQKTDFEQVVANAVPAHPGLCGPDYTNYVAHSAHDDVAPTVTSGASNGGPAHGARSGSAKEQLIVPTVRWQNETPEISPPLRAGGNRTGGDRPPGTDVDTAESLIPVAFRWQNDTTGIVPDDCAASLKAKGTTTDERSVGAYVASVTAAVRRLTPRECERLQGFPDDYTAIFRQGKEPPDGPRYKALGNSMAVPCMAWIGKRIAAVVQTR